MASAQFANTGSMTIALATMAKWGVSARFVSRVAFDKADLFCGDDTERHYSLIRDRHGLIFGMLLLRAISSLNSFVSAKLIIGVPMSLDGVDHPCLQSNSHCQWFLSHP